jgi:hypothetical protein
MLQLEASQDRKTLTFITWILCMEDLEVPGAE